MPTPDLRPDPSSFPLDSSSFPVPQPPESSRGQDGRAGLRAEIKATLDALIDGEFPANEGWTEREMRLCAEIGRTAAKQAATPEFRQAVGLLRMLRGTVQSREVLRDTSAA